MTDQLVAWAVANPGLSLPLYALQFVLVIWGAQRLSGWLYWWGTAAGAGETPDGLKK